MFSLNSLASKKRKQNIGTNTRFKRASKGKFTIAVVNLVAAAVVNLKRVFWILHLQTPAQKMSNFVINGLLQSRNPLLAFRRFRGKMNIQRPRQPHYERARVLEIVKPFYKKPAFNAPCMEAQLSKETRQVDNPYEAIVAREARNWFEQSRLVAFLHVNSIRQEDMFKVQVALHRHQVTVKVYGKSIMQKAVQGTKFEPILPLFEAKTALVFGPEERKINQLLSVLKKTPQLVLLAGIVEGRLLSKQELVAYASMPDLTTVRAQLAAVLESAGGKIVSDLQCHQQQLVNLLDAHARSNDAEPAETAGGKIADS